MHIINSILIVVSIGGVWGQTVEGQDTQGDSLISQQNPASNVNVPEPTQPDAPVEPTLPTAPIAPTTPIQPTVPTVPTQEPVSNVPTQPTLPTVLDGQTETIATTEPTVPTVSTQETVSGVPTQPTLPTLPTLPTGQTDTIATTELPSATEPVASTEATQPTLPTESTEPTASIDSITPSQAEQPTVRTEPGTESVQSTEPPTETIPSAEPPTDTLQPTESVQVTVETDLIQSTVPLGSASESVQPIAPTELADSTQDITATEFVEGSQQTEPVAQPTQPTESTEPTEPIATESAEAPTQPIPPSESAQPTDQPESAVTTGDVQSTDQIETSQLEAPPSPSALSSQSAIEAQTEPATESVEAAQTSTPIESITGQTEPAAETAPATPIENVSNVPTGPIETGDKSITVPENTQGPVSASNEPTGITEQTQPSPSGFTTLASFAPEPTGEVARLDLSDASLGPGATFTEVGGQQAILLEAPPNGEARFTLEVKEPLNIAEDSLVNVLMSIKVEELGPTKRRKRFVFERASAGTRLQLIMNEKKIFDKQVRATEGKFRQIKSEKTRFVQNPMIEVLQRAGSNPVAVTVRGLSVVKSSTPTKRPNIPVVVSRTEVIPGTREESAVPTEEPTLQPEQPTVPSEATRKEPVPGAQESTVPRERPTTAPPAMSTDSIPATQETAVPSDTGGGSRVEDSGSMPSLSNLQTETGAITTTGFLACSEAIVLAKDAAVHVENIGKERPRPSDESELPTDVGGEESLPTVDGTTVPPAVTISPPDVITDIHNEDIPTPTLKPVEVPPNAAAHGVVMNVVALYGIPFVAALLV
ncbi:unnamed protein product [Fusarium langsethiae]|nr:unnamed protein product [Fusarium langsethiae]